MATNTLKSKFQLRRDTSLNWTNTNPVLLNGEIGYDTDNKYIKIGDGLTNWNSLTYQKVDDSHKLDGKTLTQQIADNDLRYLGLTAKASDSNLLDGIDSSGFATAAQGTKANSAIQGVKNGVNSLVPDANKIVTLPLMVGASQSVAGYQGLVPTPTAGQQNLFLKGDGTFTSPTSDIIATATYVVGTSTGAAFTQNASNINVVLTSNYVSYIANPAIPNIVEVFYNGSKLLVNTDFTINTSGGNTITILNYTLVNTDVIVINYKTAIGSYGSVFQSAVEECIEATSEAITASERAENAAIEAENIADSKIDKASITGVFGQDATKVISQKGFTDNISEILQLEGEELYAYGVKWTEVQTSPTLERIGNINMHKTLPCHKVRGCLVKNDGSINYYLHPSSDLLKADGVTPSVLDGTDGDVMNYRKFYYRTAIKDGVHVNWMSPYPLQGYTLYEGFTGRYKGSINRTTGKIHSVINTTPEFRGGGNTAAWDSDGRSLLGCPVSGINRATFRNGARINRSTDWNGARGHNDNFALLIYFRVKWATHNTQLAYNAALDASGYYQGGMGSGTTNLSSAKWVGYNGYNPFIPCGYTKEFGDGSGVKAFVMSFEYDGYNTTLSQQKYTGVYSAVRGYATGEYCSDGVDSYKGSGTATLYRCKADASAGVALSNTTHFETVTRTITQAIRMDGEEQWFGEIWEFYSDVLIEMDATAQTSKCYIFRNQSQIAETRTGNEEFLCNLPITDGWIKLFNENSIFPKSTGGGSTTYGCDYTYIYFPASGVSLRGCLGGGCANFAADAGASYSYSSHSPSLSDARLGGRLVLKKRKLENQ